MLVQMTGHRHSCSECGVLIAFGRGKPVFDDRGRIVAWLCPKCAD